MKSGMVSGNGLNTIKKGKNKCTVIAVTGVAEGVGVTHSVIAMANFFRRKRFKVEVAELNDKKHFDQIEKAFEGNGYNPAMTESFRIKGVTYHKRITKDRMAQLNRKKVDVLILDIGSRLSEWEDVFQMADLGIVVAQNTDWKQEEIYRFMISWHQFMGGDIRWLLPLCEEKIGRSFLRCNGHKGSALGYLPDPFVKNKKIDEQLTKIFNQ